VIHQHLFALSVLYPLLFVLISAHTQLFGTVQPAVHVHPLAKVVFEMMLYVTCAMMKYVIRVQISLLVIVVNASRMHHYLLDLVVVICIIFGMMLTRSVQNAILNVKLVLVHNFLIAQLVYLGIIGSLIFV
jgi:hypothetical protein